LKRVYKYLLVFLGSLFLFPLVSNAECSYERQAELSKIASNVQFSYTYEYNTDNGVIMNIITNNITNDVYVVNEHNQTLQAPEDIRRYPGAKSYSFEIYSNDPNCKGELLLTRYISLPTYNRYSEYQECKTHPEFEYCQIWLNTADLTKSGFDEKLNSQLQSENVNDDSELEEKLTVEQILELLKQHYYIFIAIIILIIAVIINQKLKKR